MSAVPTLEELQVQMDCLIDLLDSSLDNALQEKGYLLSY